MNLKLEGNIPSDADTLELIHSLTAKVMEKAVQEGQIEWETKITRFVIKSTKEGSLAWSVSFSNGLTMDLMEASEEEAREMEGFKTSPQNLM